MALVLLFGLGACSEECDTNEEFSIEATFYGADMLPGRIYALDGNGNDIPLSGTKCSLPVDLSSNITTYVFEYSGHSDTLSLWFDREYYFQSKDCGYVINYFEGHVYEKSSNIKYLTYSLDFFKNEYEKDLVMDIYY